MSHARTLWEEGHEPGRAVVALGLAVTLTVVVIDLAVMGRVSLVFDVAFVLLCVGMALLVRPADFFTVGVLPPVVMLAVFTVLAVARPDMLGREGDSTLQAIIYGLSHHAIALGIGYGLCLACLAIREQVARARR